MNKVKPKIASESGITLIALLVMIILLVILAGVTIQRLTGQGGIIGVSADAAK